MLSPDLGYVPIACLKTILQEIVLVVGHAENVATAITHFSIVSVQHLAQQQRIT